MTSIEINTIRLEQRSEPDIRYRMWVALARTDRPTNFKFHCPRCSRAVAEIVNADVTAMTDVIDMENQNNFGVGVRCDGNYETNEVCTGHFYADGSPCDGNHYIKKPCRIWYYFSLNQS